MQVNLTADGVTPTHAWYGGRGNVVAWGNFGGGTLTLQMSPDMGTTWINVDRTGDTYCTFSANGSGDFEIGLCLLRGSLTGATNPNVWFSL